MEFHRPFLILAVTLTVVFTSGIFIVSAETWEKCPDRAILYGGSQEADDVTEELCDGDRIEIKHYQSLDSRWYQDNLVSLVGGSLTDISINSVTLKVEMRSRHLGQEVVDIYYWCGDPGPNNPRIEIANQAVDNDYDLYTYNITELFLECNDTHNVRFQPTGEIYMRMVNLRIEYSVTQPPGILGIYGFYLPPEPVDKYDEGGVYNLFSAYGSMTCYNGPCGNVNMVLQYKGEGWQFLDVPVGYSGDVPFYTEDNPHKYGELNATPGNTIIYSKEWVVHITENASGDYKFRLEVNSEDSDVGSVVSDEEVLSIRVGELFVEGVSIDSPIYIEGITELSGTVVCKNYNCGEVNIHAMKNETAEIVNDNDFTIYNINPVEWVGIGDGSKQVSWDIKGLVIGTYDQIHITVLPENGDVSMAMGGPVTLVVEPEPPGPYLEIVGSDLNPPDIYIGNTSELNGTVICNNDDCGNVTVYAKQGENAIPTEGSGITVPQNQKNDPCLQNMNKDEQCTVEFTITGHAAGTYRDIHMLAESASADDSLPTGFTLEVDSPPSPPAGEIGLIVLSPEGGSVFSRGDDVVLRVKVIEDGIPKEDGSVLVSFSNWLHENIQLDNDGGGYYSGSVTIPIDAQGGYEITYSVEGISEQRWINVDPNIFTVTLNTESDIYTTADDLNVWGSVIKDMEIVESSVEVILCNNNDDMAVISTQTTGMGEYSTTFSNLYNFQDRSCQIMVKAFDMYGNTGYNTKTVNILRNPNQTYLLEFIEPHDGDTVKEKESVNVKVRVLSDSGPLRDADVFCTLPAGEEFTKSLNEIGEGVYSNTILVGEVPPSGEWKLTCDTRKGGFFGGNSITLFVKPEYSINITILGSSGIVNGTLFIGEGVRFKVAVEYLNGTTFAGDDVFIRGGPGITYMNKTYIDGVYSGDFVYNGEEAIYFEAFDQYENYGNTTLMVDVESPPGWTYLIPIISGLFFLGMVPVVVKLSRRQVSPGERAGRRLKELKKRQNIIEKSKETAEVEYYQRKINEKEFKKMLDDYEEMLIPIKEEIKVIEADLNKTKTSDSKK
jgi:hypothetical protein